MSINRYEEMLVSRIRRIPRRTWLAFAAALAFGVLLHLAALTGLIVNGDNTVPVVSSRWLLTQGKWANGYLADLRGLVNMNIVTGPIGLLWLALAAALTVSVLDIRSPLLAALTGVMTVSFPSVMCTFLYNAPDIFFFALLLATLAAYVTVKYRFGYIAGVLLLTVSIGTYQTYVGYTAGLFVLVSIMDLLEGEKPMRTILRNGGKYIGVLLAAVALYYGVLLLFIDSPENLQSYRSINRMGSFPPSELAALAKAAYRKVLRFFWFDAYGVIGSRTGTVLHRCTLLLSIALSVAQALRAKLYRTPLRPLLACVLAALLPLAIHAIVILGKNGDTHWLMIYPFLLVFAAMTKLADLLSAPVPGAQDAVTARQDAFRLAAKLAAATLSVALICNWYIVSTQNYARMRLAYEGAYGTCAVIAAGVLNEEAFTSETPVAMIGYIEDDSEDFSHLDNFTGSNL